MTAPAESAVVDEEGSGGGGLVDWSTALRVAGRLVDAGGGLAAVAERVEAGLPAFRNRGYPLSPLPLFVDGAAAGAVAGELTGYVGLLRAVCRVYRDDAGVRGWYGLPPAAEALVAAEAEAAGGGEPEIGVCRLDGYLEPGTERLRVLENNADAPAGTLFTPRIHAVVRAVLDEVGVAVPAHADAVRPRDDALLDAVAPGFAEARRAGRTPVLAVLQPRGAANRESAEMAEAFRSSGVDVFVADPREVTARAGRARVGGRAVDACWNKVNTVAWQRLAAQDPGLVERWVRVLRDTDLYHVNSFLARYVAESKLTLALVQEPGFAGLFDGAQRGVAERLLPWSRAVTGRGDLAEMLLGERQDFVLKEPYDIRGDGVTVGRAVSQPVWAAAVRRAVRDGGVAQRYVAPAAYPVVRTGPAGPRVVAMPVSLDTYLVRGEVVFHGSKASLHPRVNVFQGGQKLAVHVTAGRGGRG